MIYGPIERILKHRLVKPNRSKAAAILVVVVVIVVVVFSPGWKGRGDGIRFRRSLADLLGQLLRLGLLQLGDARQGFAAVDSASPVATDLLETIVEVVSGGFDDFAQRTLVLRIDIGEGEGGASLPPDDPAEARFAFDDAIRDAHLAAEGWKMHHQLDRVHVVGDHHQLSRLLLDQSGHRVEALSDNGGPFAGGVLFAVHLLLGFGQESLLLGLSAFGAVLVQKLHHLSGGGAIQGHRELVNRRRNFETLLKDGLLSLEDDVLGPADETGQIALGLDVLTDAEILGPLLEKRIDRLLLHLLNDGHGRRGNLLPALLPLSFDCGFRHFEIFL